MEKNILITGCSSGLGFALCELYLQKNYNVYGISRKKPLFNQSNFKHLSFDLSNISKIKDIVSTFLKEAKSFDIVFLNAGTLGDIKILNDINIDELNKVYALNVYANKELLDILTKLEVKNIIIISSGASKNGYKGWSAYSLSKAGVNMLANLYANEFPNIKIFALAPGVIKTPMTDFIRTLDSEIYPSVKKLNRGDIQTPNEAALKLENFVCKIDEFVSGTYVDIRDIQN